MPRIGIAAPIIVVLGRVVQGISIGGEFASATALLVEYAPANRRMTFGSFQMSSQAMGRVLATSIGLSRAADVSGRDGAGRRVARSRS